MKRTTLTDRKVISLKQAPEGKRYQAMDGLVPGFGVRITDKGVKTYILQARFPGSKNPARREIGKVGVLTLEEARAKAREWSTLVKDGIDPALVEERARQQEEQARNNSFKAVAEDYFAIKLARQRSGPAIDKRFRRHLFPHFEKMPIGEITDLDVISTIVKPRIKATPAMARQLFNDLGAFFSWAVDQRVYGLKTSPCAAIKISKIIGRITPRQRVLNDNEIRALWTAAGRLPYPVGPMYRALLLSALRLREVSNADRSEWNMRANNWVWTIPEERMKGKLPHAVPITADLRAIYDACPRTGKFLFSFDGGTKPMHPSVRLKAQIDEEMLKVLREIAVEEGDDPASVTPPPRWTNHDIRRTVRTRLSRLKIPEDAREALLAHVKPGIQRTYDVHDYFDEKREALEAWAAALRDIVEPSPSNVVRMATAAE
jgi:integrase